VFIILHFIVLVLVHSIWKLNTKVAIRFYSVNFLYITFLLKLLCLVVLLLKLWHKVFVMCSWLIYIISLLCYEILEVIQV